MMSWIVLIGVIVFIIFMLSPTKEEKVKRVYCKDCKFCEGISCKHPLNLKRIKSAYEEIYEPISSIEVLNQNNNCEWFRKCEYRYYDM